MEADQHSRDGEQGGGADAPSQGAESAQKPAEPATEQALEASAAEASAESSDSEGSDEEASESSDDETSDEGGESSDDEGSDAEGSESSDDEGSQSPDEVPTYTERRRHHVAPALIALDRVEDDDTYKLRSEGEVDLLATDIARVGQLFPVDVRLKPPDRFQVISGFRRIKALRFLHREKVLARLHTDLTDEDALLMAFASAIHAKPVPREQIEQVRDRLEDEGRLTPLLRDMLDKAVNPDQQLEPENEQEIDADELATTTAAKLGELNQDLALLADVFASLDDEKKLELLKQLRYSAELVAYLEGITS